jgi:shikimate kinase / 3-dehydroquinate synthase
MSVDPFSSFFFLYGPPGSGKSACGLALAENLGLPFYDLDREIEARSGETISQIFQGEGELGFRDRERAVLWQVLRLEPGVVALGGGALLDPHSRVQVESLGKVVCLDASLETLLERLRSSRAARPLLAGDGSSVGVDRQRLEQLLAVRAAHYASFGRRLDTTGRSLGECVWELQVHLGAFFIRGMDPGYDLRVAPGSLSATGEALRLRGLGGPAVVASDENVAGFYGQAVLHSLQAAGFAARLAVFPAGEVNKNIETAKYLWDEFLGAGLERSSTVIALGGGVVGDLAGFAAAAFLRGVAWVALPTSLLAMVDAGLGGKTGVDLPQGKNLVGVFHAPRLVLVDPDVLATLPEVELRAALAEIVKAGLIADPYLFSLCSRGWQSVLEDLDEILRRAMAVKIRLIEADPFEKGPREALNLGHTIGHAVELASGFRLRHGEAVAIGLVREARLAERIGLARAGLEDQVREVLLGLGLPVEIPSGLDEEAIRAALNLDKKRQAGVVRFSLPVEVGEVRCGVKVEVSMVP